MGKRFTAGCPFLCRVLNPIDLLRRAKQASSSSLWYTVQDAKPAGPVIGDRQKSILDLMDKATSMGGEAEVRIVVKAK
jgi:hypothetical protein